MRPPGQACLAVPRPRFIPKQTRRKTEGSRPSEPQLPLSPPLPPSCTPSSTTVPGIGPQPHPFPHPPPPLLPATPPPAHFTVCGACLTLTYSVIYLTC